MKVIRENYNSTWPKSQPQKSTLIFPEDWKSRNKRHADLFLYNSFVRCCMHCMRKRIEWPIHLERCYISLISFTVPILINTLSILYCTSRGDKSHSICGCVIAAHKRKASAERCRVHAAARHEAGFLSKTNLVTKTKISLVWNGKWCQQAIFFRSLQRISNWLLSPFFRVTLMST